MTTSSIAAPRLHGNWVHMSLFRLIEAHSYNVPNSSAFATGKLIEGDREQVILGGEDGLLTVVDPGVASQSSEDSFIAQHQTDQSVIQLAIGNFLLLPDPVVAVLHTNSLAYYVLRYDETDHANTTFQLTFTHDLGEHAYCMCVVEEDQSSQILVETLSCRLHLFQGDQCLFSRASLPALFPGPLAYHRTTSSLNIACGYHIYSIKFSLLSSLSTSGKKISFDWSFNCGDWPLQIYAIDHVPSLPSVLVVARRNVFCLPATERDRIRWQVRLEMIAISSYAYKTEDTQTIRYLIATANNTILVYKDNQLLWNCHVESPPIQFCRSSLNSNSQHMLATLSEDGRFVIGYLGTEPHLYKPTHENRALDMKSLVDELRELEKTIGGSQGVASVSSSKPFAMSLEIDQDKIEPASKGEVPMVPIRAHFQGIPIGSTVEVSTHSSFATNIRKISADNLNISVRVGKMVPWSSYLNVVAVCTPTHATNVSKIRLPLNLILAEATPDRNAELKITIELDRHTIPINQLFPDFHTENPSSIGFQPYGSCDSTVSIFTANKTNRYRVQSDKMELLALMSRELVHRLKKEDSNIQMNSRPPLEYLQARAEKQIETDNAIKNIMIDLEKGSLELRAIEALLITKTQGTKSDGMDHIDFLFKTSHQNMLKLIEKATEKRKIKEEVENELCAVFDLIALTGEFGREDTLVDGFFYKNTQQSLSERLAWSTRKTDLVDSLETLCRHTTKALPQIIEEEKDEEEEKEFDPIDPAIETKEFVEQ